MGCSPWSPQESDTTEQLSTHSTEAGRESRKEGIYVHMAGSYADSGNEHSLVNTDTPLITVLQVSLLNRRGLRD